MQGYDDQAWLTQAISALEKKVFKSSLDKSDQKKKQNAFLSNRGFSFKVIEKAINSYWKI